MKRKLYKICVLKLVVGFLVLSYSLAYGADPKAEQNNQNPPVPAWDSDKEKRTPDLPDFMLPPTELFPDIPGVVLFFHHPPNKEEIAIIMKYASEHGLKKISAWSLPTMWTFEWDKPKDYGIAARIRDNFPKLPSLEACSLNRPLWGPASVSTSQPPPIQYNKDLCGLAKDHRTYWAQNIIGADLLREELKKKSRK